MTVATLVRKSLPATDESTSRLPQGTGPTTRRRRSEREVVETLEGMRTARHRMDAQLGALAYKHSTNPTKST
jgi:hypothetical protein